MTFSVALPRAKARRRRRRPLPPYVKFLLAMVLINAVFLCQNLVRLMLGTIDALGTVMAAVQVYVVVVNWPFLRRELKRWWDGDE